MTPELILGGLLVSIAVGVLGWIAYTTHRTAVSVAEIGATLRAGHERFDNHERELVELRAKLVALEIEVAKLK